jgi:Putative Ig domain
VIVSYSDGKGTLESVASASTSAVANVNDAPSVANRIANQGITADAPFSLSVANTFADVDAGDSLSLSATLANGAALPSWLSFNAATGTFSGTPTNTDVGVLTLRVSATDAGGVSTFNDFVLTVNNVNHASTVANALAEAVPVPASEHPPLTLTAPAVLNRDNQVVALVRTPRSAGPSVAAPASEAAPSLSVDASHQGEDAKIEATSLVQTSPHSATKIHSTTTPSATTRDTVARSWRAPVLVTAKIQPALWTASIDPMPLESVSFPTPAGDSTNGANALMLNRGSKAVDPIQVQHAEIVLNSVRLTGMALSVGSVLWAIRAGGLFGSLLASLPAWRNLDPLPVLGRDEAQEDVDWGAIEDEERTREEDAVSGVLDGSSYARRQNLEVTK